MVQDLAVLQRSRVSRGRHDTIDLSLARFVPAKGPLAGDFNDGHGNAEKGYGSLPRSFGLDDRPGR